jgi:hypothetical protein
MINNQIKQRGKDSNDNQMKQCIKDCYDKQAHPKNWPGHLILLYIKVTLQYKNNSETLECHVQAAHHFEAKICV